MTRSKDQASTLTSALFDLGADVIEVATIAIVDPDDGGAALAAAVDQITTYDRVAVASPNAAHRLVRAVGAAGLDSSTVIPVAAVGPGTAAPLVAAGFDVDIVPDRSVGEGLVDAIGPPSGGTRLLVVRAEITRGVLAEGLTSLGWSVDQVVAYRTVDGAVTEAERAAAATADAVTFTSSSTVDRFVRLCGADAVPDAVISIGPITSDTIRGHGLVVSAEAEPHNLDGLVAAVVDWADRAGRAASPERSDT